jgi:hypothetical protein
LSSSAQATLRRVDESQALEAPGSTLSRERWKSASVCHDTGRYCGSYFGTYFGSHFGSHFGRQKDKGVGSL